MRSILVAAAVLLVSTAASADLVTIDVALDSPNGGFYKLVGQSAFIQSRTGGGTSGGQLDDTNSPGTTIAFTEIFPPPTLSDYQTFSYFGLIATYDGGESPSDLSLVIALQPGSGITRIEDLFPAGYTEAEYVAAMSGSFDSTEFLYLLDNIASEAAARGLIALPTLPRAGETLDLIGFTAGLNGDEAFKVGELTVTVVPEPGTLALVALPAWMMLARRRRSS